MANDPATLKPPVFATDPLPCTLLRDPYPRHEGLREAGVAAWSEQFGGWKMSWHEQVPDALAGLPLRGFDTLPFPVGPV